MVPRPTAFAAPGEMSDPRSADPASSGVEAHKPSRGLWCTGIFTVQWVSESLQADITKDYRLGSSWTTEVYFLSGGWNSKIGCQHFQVLVKALFRVVDCQLLVESSLGGKGERALWDLFYKSVIPIHEGVTSWPNFLSKAPPPNTITWGFRMLTF